MRGGIAERGGVRVGHKIIEMNGESVVAASHHHIVDVLQTTIGEVWKLYFYWISVSSKLFFLR